MAALAETLIAYPIARTVRLSRNHITDAGVAALIDVLKQQMVQAETPEGAGGVRKLKMSKKVRGFGAVMSEAAKSMMSKSSVAGSVEGSMDSDTAKFRQAQMRAAKLAGAEATGLLSDGGDSPASAARGLAAESSVGDLEEESTQSVALLPKSSFLRGVLKQGAFDDAAARASHSAGSQLGSPVVFPPLPGASMDSLLKGSTLSPQSVAMHTSFKGSAVADDTMARDDGRPFKPSDNVTVKQRIHRHRPPSPSQMGIPSRFDETKKIGTIKCAHCYCCNSWMRR